ncbi:MAG TPA: TIGR03435 family protein [Bryobacteraceae bacterium]|nr:TIGR03435 family protein [Bryobacteraceae bacterium]
MRALFLTGITFWLALSSAPGQVSAPPQTFDVVSIRPSQPGGYFSEFPSPDGFTARNITLRILIEGAYGGLEPYQIVGGPGWIDSEKFDVLAKSEHGISRAELGPMLQTILADRFKLVMHKEPKKLPGYALVVAKGGQKIRLSEPQGEKAQVTRNGTRIAARNLRFSQLVETLERIVGRNVIDETGIKGQVDFTLEWTRDTGLTPVPEAQSAGPSIFTAVEEQLGLKLEPRKQIGDVYVIDHVVHPSAN